MSRIADIPAEARSDEQKRLHERVTGTRGMFFSPYKVWIHSPAVGFGMEAIGTHLNSKASSLSADEMEMAALMTARHWNAAYVMKNHSAHARKAGLDEATIEAVLAGAVPSIGTERLRSVFDFTALSLRGETPTDAEFARHESTLGRAGIADILALIGYYTNGGSA